MMHAGDDARLHMLVQFEDEQLLLPADEVALQPDGTYYVDLSRDELAEQARALPAADNPDSATVLPLIAEEVSVQKRKVVSGKVRIHKRVQQWDEPIDELLLREQVDVKRVAIGQYVETAPAVRSEGSTTIIPVLEEVLVLEKRLLLREEIHVTHQQSHVRDQQSVSLRREEIEVERIPEDGETASGD